MTPLATWSLLIGFTALVCVSVGAWWLSVHMDEDTARLLDEDRKRDARRDALTSPRPWASTSWQVEDGAAGPAARSATFERSNASLDDAASTTGRGLVAASTRPVPLTSR